MNPSHSSLQTSLESVAAINAVPRSSAGAIRTAPRHRPSPMATTQRPMRKMTGKVQPIQVLPMALHPYPIPSTSARRLEDAPRPQPSHPSITYMRPALSPISPVVNTMNYIDSTFRGCAERIQAEISSLRAACSKAVFREQQEKEKWRSQCLVLQKEYVATRQLVQRISARQHEVERGGNGKGKNVALPPPASAPASLASAGPSTMATVSELFNPPPTSSPAGEPPASADTDSDGEESIVQSLVYPSPSNSPREAAFTESLRNKRCRSLPPDSELAQVKLCPRLSPRSQLFPPNSQAYTGGSPPLIPIPFIDPNQGPTYAQYGSPSPVSLSPVSPGLDMLPRRGSDAGSETSVGSTCVDSDDESSVPISKRHRSGSTKSETPEEKPLETPAEEEPPALVAVKTEPEEAPVPIVSGIPPLLHVDLMYISKSDQLHCRACMLSTRKSPTSSRPASMSSFPSTASWDMLRDHCIKEHPKESAEVSALQPADLYALRLKLYQHQQSMGMF